MNNMKRTKCCGVAEELIKSLGHSRKCERYCLECRQFDTHSPLCSHKKTFKQQIIELLDEYYINEMHSRVIRCKQCGSKRHDLMNEQWHKEDCLIGEIENYVDLD